MRINQNSLAINAYRNLSTNSVQLGKSLEKLSSGFRINRAADDAAGLVISQNLRAQIGGLRQATRNAQDGISVVQTAEGALNEVHSMLERMRSLAVQAANSGSNGATAREAAQAEITELKAEIGRIASSTEFGGVKLLDGTYGVKSASSTGADAAGSFAGAAGGNFTIDINGTGAVTVTDVATTGLSADEAAAALQDAINEALSDAGKVYAGDVSVRANVGDTETTFTIEVAGLQSGETFELGAAADASALEAKYGFGDVDGTAVEATAASGTGGRFQIGANEGDKLDVVIDSVSTTSLGIDSVDVVDGAETAITVLGDAISQVSELRGKLGASQNRFESIINNLQVATENLVASESRIRDTDMAQEMTNFTKNQILSQASTAMLAQANQVPQTVLQLLR